MSRQKVKREVLSLLQNQEWNEVSELLGGYAAKDIISPLFTAICHVDLRCRWHAISGFGQVIPRYTPFLTSIFLTSFFPVCKAASTHIRSQSIKILPK